VTSVRMFDGETTRGYEGRSQVGNVIAGRADSSDFVRPHMLLLPYYMLMVPLSTYLAGHEAMIVHPNGAWDRRLVMANTYQGECVFQGLRCHKVWCTTLTKKSNKEHDRWELWLAEDRNYIPVRCLAYTFKVSREKPVGEATVDEWQEPSPGIWYPKRIRSIAYEKELIKTAGKQQLRWRRDFVVEQVTLNPNYGVSFFRNLAFPDGTAVYEVRNDKITRGYRVGAPAGPSPSGVASRWWLVGSSMVLVVLISIIAIRRYRRSRV